MMESLHHKHFISLSPRFSSIMLNNLVDSAVFLLTWRAIQIYLHTYLLTYSLTHFM